MACGNTEGFLREKRVWTPGWKEEKVWRGLFLVSPHLDFSQPGVCVCVCVSISLCPSFSLLPIPLFYHLLGLGQSFLRACLLGNLNLGEAELH